MSTVILNDDIRKELISQKSNEDNAKLYDFYNNNDDDKDDHDVILLQPNQIMDTTTTRRNIIRHKHYDTYSFDDLFPNINFSKTFNSCTEFRNELRYAIRCDMIFDVNADDNNNDNNDNNTSTTTATTRNIQPPIYNYMSSEQRYDELSKDKPLIGYWRKQQNHKNNKNNANTDNDNEEETASSAPTTIIRFTEITKVLNQYLVGSGENAVPTGDEFINAIGSLCNSISTSTSTTASEYEDDNNDNDTPYHWTDVVGVAATQNNKMGDKTKHAWHQDYGHLQPQQSQSNGQNGNDNDNDNDNDTTNTITNKKQQYLNNKHVFLGFPYENNFHGTGVLPHIIKLKYEQWSTVEKSIFYTATRGTTNSTTASNGDNSNDAGDDDSDSNDDDGDISADTEEEEEEEQLQEQLEEYIIRPKYIPGEIEIIIFRDIDVLHSSPDIQYRSSIMRFG